MRSFVNRFSTSRIMLNSKPNQDILNAYSLLGGLKEKKTMTRISDDGFVINGTNVKGPAIILNQTLFLWDVPQYGVGGPFNDVEPIEAGAWPDTLSPFYGWTSKMFSVFKLVDQKPEILLLGAGSSTVLFPPNLKKFLNDLGIQLERQAGSTFNVLLEEGRNVALALLPPIPTSARTGKYLVQVVNA